MADLRIIDAPLLPIVKGTEKLPTGGEGNFSVSIDQVADFSKLKWVLATEGYVDTVVSGVRSELVTHTSDINNPHQVTKAQVGLSNVDNTADVDKPIGSATQAALTTLTQNKAEKTYVDTQLNSKADKATTYSKTESDSLLANKSDTSYVNTKYSSHIKTFLNTGTALSNTVNGEYFFIISNDSEKVEDLYLNFSGVATNQNKSELSSLLQHNSILGRDATGAHQAMSIGTASGISQQAINDFGGAKWYAKAGGYDSGATVKLSNGDVVKSTFSSNINNPNTNMTGWVNTNFATQIFDEGGKNQQQINNLLPTYADKSISLQAAITNSVNGNTINLSGNTYPSGIVVDSKHLVGVGYNTRINVSLGEYGIKSLATSPVWNRYKIKDLTIEGDNLNGIGFTFDEADAASGRRNIEYVSFKWLDIAINKPSGNIGNTYSDCNFDLCNYGFKAVQSATGVLMHSGCDTFRDAQFSNIKKWAIDIVNTTQGGGQFSIQDSIIQFCQGGGIRIDYGNTIPYSPITIRNVWFESIATSATVNRDGVDEVPREIKLINTPICIIEESYLKNIELINSTAIARYCRIDNSAEYPQFFIDSNSQLLLEYLYVDGFVPDNLTVKSIAKQSRNTSGSTDLSLCGEAPTSVVSSPQNASSFVGETYDGIVGQTTWELLGSQSINAGCVRDGVLQESCIEIPLTNGITSIFNNIQLTAGKWAVWGVSAKAVGPIGGKFEFSRDFKLGDVRIKFDEWVHTFGIAKIATSGLVGCWIQPSSGGSLRLQNLFIAQFDNEADAIAFANSRAAVDSRQHSSSAAWNPPSLASGALQSAVTVLSGAKIGDPVSVSFNQPLQGTFIWGEVTSDNNVTVYHKNLSATTVDLALGVLSVCRE